jgi:hypothetical protein
MIVCDSRQLPPLQQPFKEIFIFTIAYGEVYTLHFGFFIVEKQLPLSILWLDVQ